jgi:hypothetical protein
MAAEVAEQQPSQQSEPQAPSDDDFPLKFCTVCASNQNRFVPTRFAYYPLFISFSPPRVMIMPVHYNLLRRAAAGMELRKNECAMMKMSICRNYTNHDDEIPWPCFACPNHVAAIISCIYLLSSAVLLLPS